MSAVTSLGSQVARTSIGCSQCSQRRDGPESAGISTIASIRTIGLFRKAIKFFARRTRAGLHRTDKIIENDRVRARSCRVGPQPGIKFAPLVKRGLIGMSLVRLLGFTTLACGCVVGRYREVATSREVSYVEEKGKSCGSHEHRRNHTVSTDRSSSIAPFALASKAS